MDASSDSYAQGEVLVCFAADTDQQAAQAVVDALGFSAIDQISQDGIDAGDYFLVGIPSDISVDQAISSLQENANVSAAQPNFIYTIQ